MAREITKEWEITDKEIQALWTEIWPKIVAITWLDDLPNTDHLNPTDDSSYRKCFENSASFRQKEVKRVADTLTEHGLLRLEWESKIPIHIPEDDDDLNIKCSTIAQNLVNLKNKYHNPYPFKWSDPDALYGDTFFYLNHGGILLPWPDKPDLDRIFVGYAQGGGDLPRPADHGGPPWDTQQEQLYEDLTSNIKFDSSDDTAHCECLPEGITGVAILKLFEKWAEEVGTAWTYSDEGVPGRLQTNLKDHIMPEVWARWPSTEKKNEYVKVHHHDRPDFIIQGDLEWDPEKPTASGIDITVPIPDPPGDGDPERGQETIFKELIVGQATNPMYSNCY